MWLALLSRRRKHNLEDAALAFHQDHLPAQRIVCYSLAHKAEAFQAERHPVGTDGVLSVANEEAAFEHLLTAAGSRGGKVDEHHDLQGWQAGAGHSMPDAALGALDGERRS